jgi:hypothetical protein
MAEDAAHLAPEDVKKRAPAPPAGGASALGALRQAVRGLGELLGGVAEASADGFRGFNAKLASGANTSATIAEDVIDGLAEGNARFLEGVAKASRQAYDHLKAQGERRPAPEAIDYERLARLVAAELKKTAKDQG